MKKFIAILSCVVFLCGCSNIDSILEVYYEPQDKEIITDIENRKKIELSNLLNQKLWYDLSDIENKEEKYFENRNYEDADKILSINIDDVLNSMNKIDDIEIIQQNGRAVEIYKDKEHKNIIVMYDKRNISSVYGTVSKPKKYLDIINNICDESDLIFFNYRLGSKRNALSFINNEFLLFSQNNSSIIFNEEYNDVKVKLKNVPLDFVVFFDNDKIDKVHIVYIDIKYDKVDISDKNIEQIKKVFQQLDSDTIDKIIEEFKTCVKDKTSKNGENEKFLWKSVKGLKYNNRYEYNDFIIQIK